MKCGPTPESAAGKAAGVLLRDKLNRLHRRTKGYGKSVAMLRDFTALVCLSLKLI